MPWKYKIYQNGFSTRLLLSVRESSVKLSVYSDTVYLKQKHADTLQPSWMHWKYLPKHPGDLCLLCSWAFMRTYCAGLLTLASHKNKISQSWGL